MIDETAMCAYRAGIDEAGRGPLAGPVAAAVVILDPVKPIDGLMDSKKLSAARRVSLAELIKQGSLAWSIAYASVQEIDTINILQATFLAMQRAVEALHIPPSLVLVDGNCCPKLSYPARAVIGGDRSIDEISAASILAKVARDEWMCLMDLKYPGYGFSKHKGYGTAGHLKALRTLGVTPIHRRSFAPVRALC